MLEITKIILKELGLKEGERFVVEGSPVWEYRIKNDTLYFLNKNGDCYTQSDMLSYEINCILKNKDKIKI